MVGGALRRGGFVLAGFLIALGGVLLAVPVGAVGVVANTWTVNDLGDTGATTCVANAGAGGAVCQLRDAIGQAASGDTIAFSVAGTITLGGTLNLLSDVTISGPTSGAGVTVSGGGGASILSVFPGRTVTIGNLTLAQSMAGSGFPGAIFNQGTLTVASATFFNNSSAAGNGGAIQNQGTLTITNSTFSGNSAFGGGGGIRNSGGHTLTVTNSTFSDNHSLQSTGGGISNSGTLNLTNTIVAGNSAFANPDVDGTLNTDSHNLIGGTSLLATLGSFGGPTQTIPLLPGSPAIGAGDATAAGCASTGPTGVNGKDQRGIARPVATCDIGAFQSQGFTLTRTSGDAQSRPATTAFAPLIVTVAPTVAGAANNEPVDGGIVTFTGLGSGADIAPDPQTATIAGGHGSITPTANGVVGAYTITAAVATGTAPASVAFSLRNFVATQLVFTQAPPGSATAGAPFPVQVTAEDPSGAIDTTYAAAIILAPSVADAGATGLGPVTPVNGVATFSVTLTKATPGQTLAATGSVNNLTPGTSAAFPVVAAAPVTIVGAPASESATVSGAFGALTAIVKDAYGNPVPGVTVTLAATIVNGATIGGGTFGQTTNASGIATFADLKANTIAGGPYAVNATVVGVVTSAAFALNNIAATLSAIAVSAPPAIGSPPTIKVGQTAQLAVTGTYSDGSTQNLTNQVQWHSGDPSRVTVDASGVVTGAAGGGPVTITATQGGVTSQITVTVTPPVLVGVGVSPAPQGRPSGAITAPAPAQPPAPVPAGR